MQNSAPSETLGSKLLGRQVDRAENNVLPPFFPLSGARGRVFIDGIDLPFNSHFSTTGKNGSSKRYKEGPESSPLHLDLFQGNARHDGLSWYGSQREGKTQAKGGTKAVGS